ncbi:MarC family protein [Prevotella sp. 10(H)]|uniref:MarC family protein n=1 Tax=Prevotella sp. 10(H) TaxID=1158294 RepID=UPI0004A6BFF0|nr:MarC family protein [Prevotella sp. 10(H)]
MTVDAALYTFISSFIALFPVINPVGSGFIVNGFLGNLDDVQRKTVIKKIIVNVLFIGMGCLLVGHLILLLFNLAVPVIQLAGGILICKTAWGLLSDSGSSVTDATHKAMDKINLDEIENKIFYPISFPISIGPGSVSVIFTLMATAEIKDNVLRTTANYGIIALVIVSMCIILYIFLSEGHRIMKRLGTSGNLVINKLVAFFTFCIGVQIVVTGISKIFHIPVL